MTAILAHGGPALLSSALLGPVAPGARENLVAGAAAAAAADLADTMHALLQEVRT